LTDIAPDELLVAIDFHLPPADSGWCCTEIARRHGDFAIVAVAVLLGCGRDRRIDFARVALGGVGAAPLRMIAAEQALLGEWPDADLFRRAGDIAAQAVDPPADIHASSSYRRHLTAVLVRRALTTAASRVKGRAS
jgi:aerobic carbon-monoxide dehydrogenase medium subunit